MNDDGDDDEGELEENRVERKKEELKDGVYSYDSVLGFSPFAGYRHRRRVETGWHVFVFLVVLESLRGGFWNIGCKSCYWDRRLIEGPRFVFLRVLLLVWIFFFLGLL